MVALDELLEVYQPRPAPLFRPGRIVLAKGSNRAAGRRRFAERICAAYPEAEVVEAFGTPHNRVDLGESDPLRLHERGKQTLVLGEHRSAVRFSEEGGNACRNYWHFSPYGFCPYGCHYCYLAGTPGVWFSPTVKVFLNLDEILGEVDRTATRLGRPTAFYLGKLQDGLALEPLSGYARTMIPFFAQHPYARMVILTKSADVENLPDLEHTGRTILSWTVNAPEVTQLFERNTPSIAARLDAMRRCAQAGYPVRAVVMPIIPLADWQETYGQFMATLLESVPLPRITLGSICSYPQAQRLMELKRGLGNEWRSIRTIFGTCLACSNLDGFPLHLRQGGSGNTYIAGEYRCSITAFERVVAIRNQRTLLGWSIISSVRGSCSATSGGGPRPAPLIFKAYVPPLLNQPRRVSGQEYRHPSPAQFFGRYSIPSGFR